MSLNRQQQKLKTRRAIIDATFGLLDEQHSFSSMSVISTSIDTFMEFISANSNIFRLLLREHTGTSNAFRAAVIREIQHFTEELTDYTVATTELNKELANIQAEAMVKLVFSTGAEALDLDKKQRALLAKRLKIQLRFISNGAIEYAKSTP